MFNFTRKSSEPSTFIGAVPNTVVLLSQPGGCLHACVQPIDQEAREADLQVKPTDREAGKVYYEVCFKGKAVSDQTMTLEQANAFALAWVKAHLVKPRNRRVQTSWAGRLGFGLAGLSLGILFTLPSEPVITPAAMAAAQAPAAALTAQRANRDAETVLSARFLGHVTQAAQMIGIPLREAAPHRTPLYVFADPLCPYCQRLENELYALPDSVQPIILATPILGDRSFDRVSQIFAGLDPQAWKARWQRAMAEPAMPIEAQADEQSELRSKMTQALFATLELRSTPTLVAPDGRVIAGAMPAADIMTWLERAE